MQNDVLLKVQSYTPIKVKSTIFKNCKLFMNNQFIKNMIKKNVPFEKKNVDSKDL